MKSYKLNPSVRIDADQLPTLSFNCGGATSYLNLDSTKQINILYDMASTDYFSVDENGYCPELNRTIEKSVVEDLLSSGLLAEKGSAHPIKFDEKSEVAWQLFEQKKLLNYDLARTAVDLPQIGEHVFVYDNFFLREVRQKILSWVTQLPFRRIDVDREDTTEYAHYIHVLSPASLLVQSLPFTRAIHQFLCANFGVAEAHLARAHVYAGSMADAYFEHTDGESLTSVYYPGDWMEDWGGELLLKAGNEHFHAFSPTRGRLLVFPGHIPHRIGAISVNAKRPRFSIVLRYALH